MSGGAQKLTAGWRIEPPVSVPVVAGSRAATATAEPSDEPPGTRAVSHRLRRRPSSRWTSPSRTVAVGLAERHRARRERAGDDVIERAVVAGEHLRRRRQQRLGDEGMSLCAIGTLSSGPRSPAARRASAGSRAAPDASHRYSTHRKAPSASCPADARESSVTIRLSRRRGRQQRSDPGHAPAHALPRSFDHLRHREQPVLHVAGALRAGCARSSASATVHVAAQRDSRAPPTAACMRLDAALSNCAHLSTMVKKPFSWRASPSPGCSSRAREEMRDPAPRRLRQCHENPDA